MLEAYHFMDDASWQKTGREVLALAGGIAFGSGHVLDELKILSEVLDS